MVLRLFRERDSVASAPVIRRLRVARLILVSAPLALTLAARPVGSAEPSEPTFYEAVDVSLVNVDVVVTDRGGTPIAGLAREDFELLEDGKPVEITNFYAVAQSQDQLLTLDGAVRPSPTAEPLPEEQRMLLVVVVDERTLMPTGRKRLVDSLRAFLDQREQALAGSGDERIMLATYDGRIAVAQPPTTDRGQIEAALAEIVRGASGGVDQAAELSQVLRQLDQALVPPQDGGSAAGGGGGVSRPNAYREEAQSVYASIRMYMEKRLGETRMTLAAVSRLVDSLAGVPGRKALLLLSGGLAMRPGEVLFQALEKKYARYPDLAIGNLIESFGADATPELRRLIDRANTNRVTFYTLVAVDETPGAGMRTGVWSNDLQAAENFNRSNSMVALANATGGTSATDPVAAAGALDLMRRDIGNYYSLAYAPARRPSAGAGPREKTRKLEVRVKRDGAVVRTRESYRLRDPEERAADRTMAALLLDEESNSIGAAVAVGVEHPAKDPDQREVELDVTFPIANVVLLPGETFHEGNLLLFVGARDARGRDSGLSRIAVPIKVPNQDLLTVLGQNALYRTRLLLRREEHVVAVGIRDVLGNTVSTVRTTYRPGSTEGSSP
jgi:VWFA-related protein